jgi:hypothetical protein
LQVKANVGASGMSTYPIGNANFDTLYKDGSLTTRLSYFYLPVMFQQRIFKYILLEGGFQAGMRTKVTDEFTKSAFDGDLSYKVDTRDDYTRLDAGLLGGVGIKLRDQPKSMSIGFNYYYGLVNVSKVADTKIRNSTFYLYVKVPIGIGSKKKNEA